jgi:hypothetical protein
MNTRLQAAGAKLAAIARASRLRLGVMSDRELRDAYLNEATDRIDLEMRIRELDRRKAGINLVHWQF